MRLEFPLHPPADVHGGAAGAPRVRRDARSAHLPAAPHDAAAGARACYEPLRAALHRK